MNAAGANVAYKYVTSYSYNEKGQVTRISGLSIFRPPHRFRLRSRHLRSHHGNAAHHRRNHPVKLRARRVSEAFDRCELPFHDIHS